MKITRFTALSALAAAALSSSAFAAPSASITTPGLDFQQYSAGPVGDNDVNDDDTLYWIDEKLVSGIKSYLIFWDPYPAGTVGASITFDAPIVALITTQSGLMASEPTYGAAGITYNYDATGFTGLEPLNTATFAGNVLTINWWAATPGDHIRVLTAVPEISRLAMFALGLAAMGLAVQRRNRG